MRMNTTIGRRLVLCVLALLSFAGTAAAAMEAPEGFLSDYDTAVAKAKAESKLLYIHFTTDWCGWCRKIESEVYPDAKVRQAMEKFVAVSLDCTEGSSDKAASWDQLRSKLGGSGYPTLAMVTPDGQPLNVVGGYVPAPALVVQLDKASDMWKKFAEFRKYAKDADKNSLEYNLRAMDIYDQMEDFDKASAAATKVISLDEKNSSGKLAQAHQVLLRSYAYSEKKIATGDIAKIDSHIAAIAKLRKSGSHKDVTDAKLLKLRAISKPAEFSGPEQLIERADLCMKLIAEIKPQLKTDPARVNLQQMTAYTGIMYANVGKLDKAVEVLEESIAILPNGPRVKAIKNVIEQIKGHQH